jgi:hypothetical protein
VWQRKPGSLTGETATESVAVTVTVTATATVTVADTVRRERHTVPGAVNRFDSEIRYK